jgi:hypothetical protein
VTEAETKIMENEEFDRNSHLRSIEFIDFFLELNIPKGHNRSIPEFENNPFLATTTGLD